MKNIQLDLVLFVIVEMRRRAFESIIADVGYDSDAFRTEITARGAEAIIRPRKNRTEDRPYDEILYKLRIEVFSVV